MLPGDIYGLIDAKIICEVLLIQRLIDPLAVILQQQLNDLALRQITQHIDCRSITAADFKVEVHVGHRIQCQNCISIVAGRANRIVLNHIRSAGSIVHIGNLNLTQLDLSQRLTAFAIGSRHGNGAGSGGRQRTVQIIKTVIGYNQRIQFIQDQLQILIVIRKTQSPQISDGPIATVIAMVCVPGGIHIDGRAAYGNRNFQNQLAAMSHTVVGIKPNDLTLGLCRFAGNLVFLCVGNLQVSIRSNIHRLLGNTDISADLLGPLDIIVQSIIIQVFLEQTLDCGDLALGRFHKLSICCTTALDGDCKRIHQIRRQAFHLIGNGILRTEDILDGQIFAIIFSRDLYRGILFGFQNKVANHYRPADGIGLCHAIGIFLIQAGDNGLAVLGLLSELHRGLSLLDRNGKVLHCLVIQTGYGIGQVKLRSGNIVDPLGSIVFINSNRSNGRILQNVGTHYLRPADGISLGYILLVLHMQAFHRNTILAIVFCGELIVCAVILNRNGKLGHCLIVQASYNIVELISITQFILENQILILTQRHICMLVIRQQILAEFFRPSDSIGISCSVNGFLIETIHHELAINNACCILKIAAITLDGQDKLIHRSIAKTFDLIGEGILLPLRILHCCVIIIYSIVDSQCQRAIIGLQQVFTNQLRPADSIGQCLTVDIFGEQTINNHRTACDLGSIVSIVCIAALDGQVLLQAFRRQTLYTDFSIITIAHIVGHVNDRVTFNGSGCAMGTQVVANRLRPA